MSTFDDREKQFEAKFSHDEELRFKVTARRNRLLGEWAGELLGFSGADREAYAKEVVMADFEKPGDDDVVEKVMADFAGKNVDVSEHRLRRRMEELMDEAKQQVMTE